MWSKYGWWRLCCYAGLSGSSADGSDQMSDCEQFAQITQDKWATVSESLRLLMTNERFAQVAHDKWANERVAKNFLTKSLKSYFLVRFLYVKKPEQFAHSLFFNEWYEQFAQVAHQKWVTMIDLLRSLTKTEQMSESLVFLSKLFIPLLFRKNERFI